jgi:hypothetical protein
LQNITLCFLGHLVQLWFRFLELACHLMQSILGNRCHVEEMAGTSNTRATMLSLFLLLQLYCICPSSRELLFQWLVLRSVDQSHKMPYVASINYYYSLLLFILPAG